MIDHIVFAVQVLEEGMDQIERLSGVRPIPGGKHQGRGTHNALLSFGGGAYLEVIAPDPEQDVPAEMLTFGLATGGPPRLATWAMKAPAIDALVERAKAAGFDPGPVQAMTRDVPGGEQLAWRLTRRRESAGDGLVPFLIDWGESPHPSQNAPIGGSNLGLRCEHPDPASIRDMFTALGIDDVAVAEGAKPALVASFETAKGRVELR